MTGATPFAVSMDSTGQRVNDRDMYVTIAHSSKIENSKRHHTSTQRFGPHSVEDSMRSTHCQDIDGAQPGTTLRPYVTFAYGTDKEMQAGIYKPAVQTEIGAYPSCGHEASFAGVLGDVKLGHLLPHRSKSYNLSNRGNPSSLQSRDIFGAYPSKRTSKFLLHCSRQTDPLAPQYQLPTCPSPEPLPDKCSGRDSLDTTDLVFSAVDGEIRPVHGVGSWSSVERRARRGSLNLDKTKTLEERGSPAHARADVTHGVSDIPGATHSTMRHLRVKHRFGRDDRNPLGNDTRQMNNGPSCPGLLGTSFRSQRHTNPLEPTYTLAMHSSLSDLQTHFPRSPAPRPSTARSATQPLHPDVDAEAAKLLSPRSTYAPSLERSQPVAGAEGMAGGGALPSPTSPRVPKQRGPDSPRFKLRDPSLSPTSPRSKASSGAGSPRGMTGSPRSTRLSGGGGGKRSGVGESGGVVPRLKIYTQGGLGGEDRGQDVQQTAGVGVTGSWGGRSSGLASPGKSDINVRVEAYGKVHGSKPANLHLNRLHYEGRSPDLKVQTSLVTEDVDGATIMPIHMLKTQLGGGKGAWRKADKPRRQVRETNQVADIAGDPEGRPKFDSMVRTVRHSDPMQPLYKALDGSGGLAAPEGSSNPRHVAARKLYERVDKREALRAQVAQTALREEVSAVELLS